MIEYKLSDILQIADKWFKTLFGGFDFWCTSEIIKIQQIGKNTYMELVEYEGEGKVKAKAKACIFDEAITKKFLQQTSIRSLAELAGAKILFHGYFSFHQEYGFSIVIKELSAEYTIGQLQKKQDDILLELQKLWIAYNNKQQQWWCPTYTVAVISSETSAGLKDFQTVIEQSGYRVHYSYYFCAIHGNDAMDQVHMQLQKIYADIQSGKKIDAVAIVRGGGGSSGIIWQNDLNIAKGICLMPVPVIVAIGHTPDKFILQELAWYGAKTPTDAAYKVVEVMDGWSASIDEIYENIVYSVEEKIVTLRERIETYHNAISQKLVQYIRETRLQIDAWYSTISAVSPEKLLQHGYALLLQNWEYITKEHIDSLKTGDSLQMKIYHKNFIIEIKEEK